MYEIHILYKYKYFLYNYIYILYLQISNYFLIYKYNILL